MKNYICLISFIIFFVSCNTKKKDDAPVVTGHSKNETAAGVKRNGVFHVVNPDSIKKVWEAKLSDEGIKDKLENFEIIRSEADSTHQEHYMLVGKNNDGTVKIAALLVEKEGQLFIEKEPAPGGGMAYVCVICTADCNDGCNPAVTTTQTGRYLKCSPCIDCEKLDVEMR